MKLLNFKIDSPVAGEIHGLGTSWDLHNFGKFVGADLSPTKNEVTLKWTTIDPKEPWGAIPNKALGCQIVFRGVTEFTVRTPTSRVHPEDADGLESLSLVDPNSPDFPHRKDGKIPPNGNMRFKFSDGGWIEIAAESAELVSAPNGFEAASK